MKGSNVKYLRKVSVNGIKFASYKYRLRPEDVTHLRVDGDVEVAKVVYSSRSAIVPPSEMYWRSLGGGHLLQVIIHLVDCYLSSCTMYCYLSSVYLV